MIPKYQWVVFVLTLGWCLAVWILGVAWLPWGWAGFVAFTGLRLFGGIRSRGDA